MKAAEKIIDVLIEYGIDYVFGIPGGSTGRFFDAIYDKQDKIKCILVRHEQNASIMADMYGRLTGKPGVFICQGAFAGTTAAFGVVEAFLTSSPMLALTDFTEGSDFKLHAPMQCGIGEYGSFDLEQIYRSITKYTAVADTPTEAVQAVQLALKHATTGRPGPTSVIVSRKAVTEDIDLERPLRIYPIEGYLMKTRQTAVLKDVKKAVDLLLKAERPVIIAGNGVKASFAYKELQELAELCVIPVTTSYAGISAFPETHPLALGKMGMFGQTIANKIVSEADVLLIIGCRLKSWDTIMESEEMINPARQKIIQIDIEPRNAGWVFPINIGLIGDAKAVLQQIIDVCKDKLKKKVLKELPSIKILVERKKKEGLWDDPGLHSEKVPIHPARIVKELRETLAPSAIIVADAGNNRHWLAHFFRTKMAGTYYGTSGIAGCGWGVPAVVTAKLLYPNRQCVSFSSDGGFAMCCNAVSTAKQYDTAAIWVVENNSALQMIRDGQGDRIFATEYIETDFAKIGEGFGVKGIRVERPSEIRPALEEAIKSGEPTVIDVITSKEEKFGINYRSPLVARARPPM